MPKTSNNTRFQYTGQVWLPELGGMYSYKARFYSPVLGRFLQTDPVGYGDGMNMYAYVKADPVNSTDPSGLWLVGPWTPPPPPQPDEEDIIVTGSRGGCLAANGCTTFEGDLPSNLVDAGQGMDGDNDGISEFVGAGDGAGGAGAPGGPTPADIAKAKQKMIRACANNQRSVACQQAKAELARLLKLYHDLHPLPEATGDQKGIDPKEGLKMGLERAFCALSIAGAVKMGTAAYKTVDGAAEAGSGAAGAALGCFWSFEGD